MNGWIVLLLLVAAVGLGLWRWFRKDMGALQFLAAAMLIAAAGYAWQGRPDLAGAPKEKVADERRPKSEFAQLRRLLLGETDAASQWLTVSDALLESGETGKAVKVLEDRLQVTPRDMDLWLGLGDALIQHANGQITPAADIAFNRAAGIGPQHPAPRFFYAIALAKNGRFDEANRFWTEVLALPDVTPQWRDAVDGARRWAADLRARSPARPRA